MLKQQLIIELIVFAAVLLFIILINGKIISYFQSKVNKMVSTDMLTKLKNRRTFDAHLKEVVQEAGNNIEPIALAIFDIDKFKDVNDTYGHAVGDEVLKAFAEVTSSMIRANDMISRWGGDEFAIVFHCPLFVAKKVVERIKQACKRNEIIKKYNVTASFGMTEWQSGDNVDSILRRADIALYSAKEDGRDSVHIG